jgi:hypothetical protein
MIICRIFAENNDYICRNINFKQWQSTFTSIKIGPTLPGGKPTSMAFLVKSATCKGRL